MCFHQQDSRFNQEIDKKTGYRTRSILCMPILDHYHGEVQYNTWKIWDGMNPVFYTSDPRGSGKCSCSALILAFREFRARQIQVFWRWFGGEFLGRRAKSGWSGSLHGYCTQFWIKWSRFQPWLTTDLLNAGVTLGWTSIPSRGWGWGVRNTPGCHVTGTGISSSLMGHVQACMQSLPVTYLSMSAKSLGVCVPFPLPVQDKYMYLCKVFSWRQL